MKTWQDQEALRRFLVRRNARFRLQISFEFVLRGSPGASSPPSRKGVTLSTESLRQCSMWFLPEAGPVNRKFHASGELACAAILRLEFAASLLDV